MFKYSKDGVTVAVVLDKRRMKQTGCYPVKIRVAYRRIQKYFATGKDLSTQEWGKIEKARSEKLITTQSDILSTFDLIKKNVQELTNRGEFSFEALNILLGRKCYSTINEAFGERIEQLKKEQRIGNMLWYENVLKSLERFDSHKLSLDSITVLWLKKYETFLNGEAKSSSTISMHMRAIRAIMNEAKSKGLIKEAQYPFGKGKFEIQQGEGRKKALTIQQIEKIVRYNGGSELARFYRDLWFFIYLCNGINVADLIKLKYSNIQDGEICFVRQKTENTTKRKREIRAIITEDMAKIIRLWGNEPKPNNYIFPFLSGQETALELKLKTQNLTRSINRQMHLIGQKLNIGNISTYTARHSFATVLKRSGANIAFISESLGHNDLKTTAVYLASFEKEEREKNAKLLTRF